MYKQLLKIIIFSEGIIVIAGIFFSILSAHTYIYMLKIRNYLFYIVCLK